MFKKFFKYIKKTCYFLTVFLILVGWVFSDYVQFFDSSMKVKEAEATIAYGTEGLISYSNATLISPAYPASIAAGDLLILLVGQKPNTANEGVIATPDGWTAITSLTGAGGYGTSLAADTGNTNIFSFYKIAEGNESGTNLLTPFLITNNSAWSQIYRLTNATNDWSVAGTTGSDSSGDSSVSITMSSDPGVTSGDFILGAMVIPTDVTTPSQFSAEAFSQTGVTFGTVTEISEPDYTGGNQIGGFVVRSSVSSGTSSAAPVMTATAGGTTTNVRGPGIFIRIRATGTITYQTEGALSYINNVAKIGVCPGYPASLTNGDLIVMIIGMKPETANGGSITVTTGWTSLTSLTGAGGYGTTIGADVGNMNIYALYKVATGNEGVASCTAVTDSNVAWAQMFSFTNDSDAWSVAGTTGSDTSGDSSVSITMSSDPGVTSGDFILGAMVIPTDVTTPSQFSSEAFSQTGVTFGTVTEVSEPDSGTSNDIGGFVVRSSVSSGTSSAAPVMTATAGGTTTDVRGPGVFVRVREVPPTFSQSGYRFFNNSNGTSVGSTLAAQNTSATLASSGDAFRLRMLLHVASGDLILNGESFKLQFALKNGTCDTSYSGESYADITGSTVIAYKNNATPADGDNLTADGSNDPAHSTHVVVNQDYEESNSFTNSVGAININEDGKWDFSLFDNGATAGASYCFRTLKNSGSAIDTPTVVPEITMASSTSGTLTFSISDLSIGFGTLSSSGARYATGDQAGSASETTAHTLTASTNATNGYAITVQGSTLTSGANTISAIGNTSAASSAGTEQFGIRITASGGNGSVTSPYNHASNYAYAADATTADEIASDADGDDVATTYSVRYVANISGTTEAGSYSSTLTYVITAGF